MNRWRARFVRDRLKGLLDAPRSGRPPRSCRIGSRMLWWPRWCPRWAIDTHWSRASMA
ncbi:hypothetical protein LWC34_42885 [Kibdelosporangium philippinense]|uniref:Uncharacterized protein n=1 Tax=Kibdelosporangium philippinense TaxID=211113 RepID=A0ABS8ZP43_9PSEU|nr:hypothetical protein [Kibdelosporangium philippinense]MCE7009509.1 hypothetical protein [Kibdelosporangium philippinense]